MSPRVVRSLAALRHQDAKRIAEIFPTQRRAELLAAIVAGDAGATSRRATGRVDRARRPGGRRPRLARGLTVPALAGLAACAVAVTAIALSAPTPAVNHRRHGVTIIHTAPVSFRYPTRGPGSGYIVATVTDPFAAQSSLDAAFEAAGLDIIVTLEPVPPSLVGTILYTDVPIQTLTGGACATDGGGIGACPVGLRIPRNFTGQGAITLGRPARPGESYEASASAFAPGESLHCTDILGDQVGHALSQLAADGITPQWHLTAPGAPVTSNETPPPDGYFIIGGFPVSSGVVALQTRATPPSSAETQSADPEPGKGC
jgi:hypothetical protein